MNIVVFTVVNKQRTTIQSFFFSYCIPISELPNSGVRTSKKPSLAPKQLSLQQQLHQNAVDLIKKQGDVGVGSSVDRFLRWQSTASGTSQTTDAGPVALVPPLVPPTGNAANAAINAQAIAKRVWCHILYMYTCLYLMIVFRISDGAKMYFVRSSSKYHLPDILAEAQITSLTPLDTRIGDD
jgi:hypothetical protein